MFIGFSKSVSYIPDSIKKAFYFKRVYSVLILISVNKTNEAVSKEHF